MWYAQHVCDYRKNSTGTVPIPHLLPFYRPRLIADELGTLKHLAKRRDHAALFVAYRAAPCQHLSGQSSYSIARGAGRRSPMAGTRGSSASSTPFCGPKQGVPGDAVPWPGARGCPPPLSYPPRGSPQASREGDLNSSHCTS